MEDLKSEQKNLHRILAILCVFPFCGKFFMIPLLEEKILFKLHAVICFPIVLSK